MNRPSLLVTTFLTFWFILPARGQDWTREDFNVSFLKLNASFDSVSVHLGRPDTVYEDHIYHSYFRYQYPGLVVWRNKLSNRVRRFQIQSPSFLTRRGVRIGDSQDKIQRLCGSDGKMDTHFDIAGPFDYSFRDYSQIITYSRGDLHFTFFMKGQILVRMLAYVDLVLTNDDWTLGFLKLDSSFDSVTIHLGKPDSTTEGDYGSTGFYYPKLVLWREDGKNTLFAMDIYDPTFVTHRGLRVGDPATKISSLYYDDHFGVDAVFERFGPYDFRFKDYSEVIVYAYGNNFFVVFTKGERVVKLLLYVGVSE